MLHKARAACLTGSALAVLFSGSAMSAGAQSFCAPASRASLTSLTGTDATGIMSRTVSLRGRDVSLREALDRLAAAAHIRLSYASELLPLNRPVCLDYGAATVGHVLADLLQDAPVQPVILSGDQVVLTPVREKSVAEQAAEVPQMLQKIGQLDRVVVTGSAAGASQRSLPIALDVVTAKQLSQKGSTTLSSAIDGDVPGLWLWEQSPLSLLARYGSIRGASSFGVSYPKVYIDGIEVANSLLVTHLDPESISRIEVIRGPQGAALYGAPQYDPLLFPNPAYSITNARLGWRVGGADISVFVNNLANAHPLLSAMFEHSTVFDSQDWTFSALRPRTYGLTVTYRD